MCLPIALVCCNGIYIAKIVLFSNLFISSAIVKHYSILFYFLYINQEIYDKFISTKRFFIRLSELVEIK